MRFTEQQIEEYRREIHRGGYAAMDICVSESDSPDCALIQGLTKQEFLEVSRNGN